MKRTRPQLAAGLLLAAACASSCAAAPPRKPSHLPDSPGLAKAAWSALSVGDFDAARKAFGHLQQHSERVDEATAGQILVAEATSDERSLRTLVRAVRPETASPLLVVTAAEAAQDLRPLPENTAALAARACAVRSDRALGFRASSACAFRPLADARVELESCSTGCRVTSRLDLYFVGDRPVVMASVNGHEPAPFIVDTGASTSVLTPKYAAKIGIRALPGTEREEHAVGGAVPASTALVTLEAGGVTVQNNPVALIDLPVDEIAGIISPEATWRMFAVDFDLRGSGLTLSPTFVGDGSMVALPFYKHSFRPILLVQTPGRPARPVVLDTGASETDFSTEWEALGPALVHVKEGRSGGAEKKLAASWTTRGDIEATAGDFSWTIHSPTVSSGITHSPGDPILRVGHLGMDMMMGRHVVIDTPHGKLWFSREAKLGDWPVGAVTTYLVTIPGAPAPIAVSEKVVNRGEDWVELEVSYKHPNGEKRFRYRMPDTWDARGDWLISRSVLELWDLSGDGDGKRVEAKLAPQYWLPVFVSFKTVLGAFPRIAFELTELHGRRVSCTTMTVPAIVGEVAASLVITQCPADPWRTKRLTLRRSQDGRVLWDVQR